MQYRVTLSADVLVDVESGGGAAALRIARDVVANGWHLGFHEGADKLAGHFMVKGLSSEVSGAVPFNGNRNVSIEATDEGEKED